MKIVGLFSFTRHDRYIRYYKKINAQKKAALKTPTSATFNEVISEVTTQVKNEINQMVQERKIVYNKTLNSFSFKVADDIIKLKE